MGQTQWTMTRRKRRGADEWSGESFRAKSVREDRGVPEGTRFTFPPPPGTAVPGFHMPPLRGWNVMIPFHLFSQNSVLTHTLKPNPNVRLQCRPGRPAPPARD